MDIMRKIKTLNFWVNGDGTFDNDLFQDLIDRSVDAVALDPINLVEHGAVTDLPFKRSRPMAINFTGGHVGGFPFPAA